MIATARLESTSSRSQAGALERGNLPPSDESELELTIVMPCLNEALTVGTCVAKALRTMRELGIEGEVVIVDNGSTDRSVEIATTAGARVVYHPLKGYGNALRRGFLEARGRFIVMGDADDSYDFTDIKRFVDKLRAGADLVMGNRLAGEIKPGAMPWLHRWVGNPLLSGFLNLLFRTGVGDSHCGMRGFRKDAVMRMNLQMPGMELASEMVIKSSLVGLRIEEIPITLWPDGRTAGLTCAVSGTAGVICASCSCAARAFCFCCPESYCFCWVWVRYRRQCWQASVSGTIILAPTSCLPRRW